MAVLHRLLLVIIWGAVLWIIALIYYSSLYSQQWVDGDTDFMSDITSKYLDTDGLGYVILAALVINLLVNWIITGEYSNFAGLNKKKSKETE